MPHVTVTGQALIHRPLAPPAAGCGVAAMLRDSDLAFANLEASVEAPGAWPTKVKTVHTATADALHSLRTLGFGALGHANNHAFDLGPPGIAATHAAAQAAGLALAGSGVDADAAARPAQVGPASGRIAVIAADLGPQPEIVYAGPDRAGINPLRMRRTVVVPPAMFATLGQLVETLGDGALQRTRAAVGYRGGLPRQGLELFGTEVAPGDGVAARWSADGGDLDRIGAQIDAARAAAALVLVCLHNHHWKADWGDTPDWFFDLGRALIDRGADLVVGHGVPVLQRIAFHRGRPIFGSLGNFVFHTRRAGTYDREGVDVWSGALCRCRFAADGTCLGIDVLPVDVGRPEPGDDGMPPSPAVLRGAGARRVVERLTAGLGEDGRGIVRCLA